MINKICTILSVFIFSLFLTNKSDAFFYPVGPVIDPLNISGESAGTFATAANKVINAQASINEYTNSLKKAIAEKIAGILGGKRKPGKAPGARKVARSDFVNYNDEVEIKEKVYELFWTYPDVTDNSNERFAVEKAYQTKTLEFYQDNIIEVWAAVRGLEIELESLRAEHATLTEELRNEDGTDDKKLGINELWKNAYEAYKTYDALYALIEEMTAMKAQLMMSNAIQSDVKPRYKIEVQSKVMTYKQDFAFATQDLFLTAPSVRDGHVPFKTTGAKVQELKKFENVDESVQQALEYHNLIHQLPSYKNVFDSHKQMQRLHQKSKEMLDESENCVIAFLSRYYKNPQEIWNKRNLGENNNDHSLREGLSGWAYNLFITDKADLQQEIESEYLNVEAISTDEILEETQEAKDERYENATPKENENMDPSSIISDDLLAELPEEAMKTNDDKYGEFEEFAIITEETSSQGEYVTTQAPEAEFDLDAQEKEAESADKKYQSNNTSLYTSEAQEEQAQAQLRSDGQTYWNIGSFVIKDLLINPEKWNAQIKAPQEVWPDNKMFYAQYITNKNENIKSFLTSVSLDAVTKRVSDLINKDKQDYDTKEINKAQAEIKEQNKTVHSDGRITYDNAKITSQLRQKTQEIKEYSSTKAKSAYNNFTDAIKDFDASGKIVEIINKYNQELQEKDYKEFTLENHDDFVKTHKDMFNELKSSVEDFDVSAIDGSVLVTINLVEELWLASSIATSDYNTVDDQYFVGKNPSKKDFKAPKALPQTLFINPREIIYFDDIDWVNAGGKSNVTKQKFLNYGGYVPTIWELLLQDEVFVETDFDLNAALQKQEYTNNSDKEFYRGGRYPCILEGKVVDIATNIPNNVSNATVSYTAFPAGSEYIAKYPACIYEEKFDIDLATGLNGTAFPYVIVTPKGRVAVELVMFDNHLTQRPAMLSTFLSSSTDFLQTTDQIYANIDKERNDTTNTEKQDDFHRTMFGRMPFATNQIGDFLRVADVETGIRKNVDELSAQIEIIKWGEKNADGTQKTQGLYDKLSALGFPIAEGSDIDLSDDQTYSDVMSLLNNAKDYHVSSATLQLTDIVDDDNEVAAQRKEDYNLVVEAIKRDRNELIPLGMTPISLDELDERLLQESVNQEAYGTYQIESDEAMENAINDFPSPYCAAY